MNISSVTEKVRQRIQSVIRETVAEVTKEVTAQVIAEIGADVVAPAKRAPRVAKATKKKAPAAKKRSSSRVERPSEALAFQKKPSQRVKKAAKPGGIRYGLDPNAVLVELAARDAGAKAEVLRSTKTFKKVPAPVFTRALKKLVKAGLVEVAGERRAAVYTATARGRLTAKDLQAEGGSSGVTGVVESTEAEGPPPGSTRLLQDNGAAEA